MITKGSFFYLIAICLNRFPPPSRILETPTSQVASQSSTGQSAGVTSDNSSPDSLRAAASVIKEKLSDSSQILADNPQLACNQEIMISYGLTGYGQAMVQPHQFCPSVTDNCCTPDDELASMHYWSTDARFKIERYYEITLYAIKYLIGYSPEVFLLAREFEQSAKLECKKAAVDYLSMNLNPQLTRDIYNTYTMSLGRMSDLRRGFYCTLCDVRTQSKLRDFWASSNLFYQDRLYYSRDFCRKLVDQTIRASFYTVNYFKRYTENMAQLMNCKTGATDRPTFDISFWTRQQTKNCFFFRRKYFFFFCENYCEKFSLTKASPLLDGDLLNLRKFTDFVTRYRNKSFKYPVNNILMDGVTYEENFMKDMYSEVLRDVVFFRAGSEQQVLLDKFKTDVVYYGGMDPYLPAENCKFELVMIGADITRALLTALALAALAVFG